MFKIVLLWLLVKNSSLFLVPVHIDLHGKPACVIDERFLSVAIGSGKLQRKHHKFNFHNPRFLTLSKGLNALQHQARIYLRIGGSAADHINFDPAVYTYTREDFQEIYQFADSLNWRFVFDLNCLDRQPNGMWDPANAVELITFALKMKYSVDYELGNEPDLFPTHLNLTIAPGQLAKDYKTLKSILNDSTKGKSLLIGPDIATLTRYDYFENFLKHINEGVLDRVSFHHYYSASTNVTAVNFTDIQYLDEFLKYGVEALSIIKRSFSKFPHPPVWIGETSSTYGGGNPTVGCSFVAGFLWLDKLGLAAQMNIDVVARQALQGGHYSLIDRDYSPCPDYWISVLYKQLVGNRVLTVTGFLQYNRTLRLYAHCTNKYNMRNYDRQSVVLFALNVNMSAPGELQLPEEIRHFEVDEFLFTSGDSGKIDSRFLRLNGQVLKMINDTALPKMLPRVAKQPIVMPPHSYGFYVLKNVKSEACRYDE